MKLEFPGRRIDGCAQAVPSRAGGPPRNRHRPGFALDEHRQGLPPHPLQIAVGRAVRERILEALDGATNVVFSHFHGNHVPLADANPCQLAFAQLPPRCPPQCR